MLGGYTPSYNLLLKDITMQTKQTNNIVYYTLDNGEVLTLDELYKRQREELEKQFPNHWTLKCLSPDDWLATPENPWGLTKAK